MTPQSTLPAGPAGNFAVIPVAVVDHAFDKHPGERPLIDMAEAIRDGAVADQIRVIRAIRTDTADAPDIQAAFATQIARVRELPMRPDNRAALDADRAAYVANPHAPQHRESMVDWLKKGLPGIIFGGTFTQRKAESLQNHSGLICIDADDVPDPATMVATVGADPHCALAFVSPTGTGAKFVIRVPISDAEGHKERTFPAVAAYLSKTYGLIADDACNDVVRLCYASHDPNAVLNLNANMLPVPVGPPVSASHSGPSGGPITPGEDYNERGDVASLLRKHGWSSSDEVHWTRPGKSSGTSATLGNVEGPPRCLWVFDGALSTEVDGFTVQRQMKYSATAEKEIPYYRFGHNA